jgi:hypothetical protein
MKNLLLIILIILFECTTAQHQNIKISDINNPNEPSICLNYFNLQCIVAGANINSYYYSSDGGLTWTRNELSSTFGVYGDPCIISDKNGDFYFLHLSSPQNGNWLDRIVCQKSTDNGKTWNNGSFMGLNSTKDQDKQWMAIDFSNNYLYTTWTQFDSYGSTSSNDKSNILFSKSTDGGETWSDTVRINELAGDCIDSDNTTEGAVPAVGINGEIYVAWAYNNKIYFDRSLDKGTTWLDHDIEVAEQPGGWDYSVPGIFRSNGLPVTCCDTSNSVYRGSIYINWTDQKNGSDDTDVWLVKSTDGGNTWSNPKRVNDDTTHTHQFLTWMTIDQANGFLYFVFYDRRAYQDETTDVYMAVSKDGGETFTNFKISETPFLPVSDVFFGDYNNITAYNNVVRPIWTRLNYSNGENGLSVWTAIINTDDIGQNINSIFPVIEDVIYPNPASNLSFYSFKLRQKTTISLYLYDSYGKVVKKIIDNKNLNAGKYIEKTDIKKENLLSGLYMYVLTYDNKLKTKKLIVENNP